MEQYIIFALGVFLGASITGGWMIKLMGNWIDRILMMEESIEKIMNTKHYKRKQIKESNNQNAN